jgi:2-polyprenyl-3-methyl-5-hydroxy-6-metoxy-1,4-benzoquinol methylase
MKDKNILINNFVSKKNIQLPKHVSFEWSHDPKHLCFSLSRYKFVSKMLEGMNSVLEIGAAEGFKSAIVSKVVNNLTLSDYTDTFRKSYHGINEYIVHDFTKSKLYRQFDGIYALDVIEHIDKKYETKFLKNILHSLKKNGVLIFGCPSIESQKYASKISKMGHVNTKNKKKLKELLLKYFHCVFPFSMNDEVLHTGFDKMSHYILVCCTSKRTKN